MDIVSSTLRVLRDYDLPTKRRIQLNIYDIRITVYQFFTIYNYNGLLPVFLRFSQKTKNQFQFSPERVLRLPKLKLIFSNERGGLQKAPILVLWFWVRIFLLK